MRFRLQGYISNCRIALLHVGGEGHHSRQVVVCEIKGKVSDEKGEALPGVNILLKGTQRGMVTDAGGLFSIDIPDAIELYGSTYTGKHKELFPFSLARIAEGEGKILQNPGYN